MCGFTAIISSDDISLGDLEKLKVAAENMRYRGPDEAGLWSDSRVAASHVRLSIIGLQNGHQPIVSADGTLVLICNGEIYNHRLLRESLERKGHVFKTLSDSEVIIHSYVEYGMEFLCHIRGMFAFLLYDIKNGSVLAVRDVAGKKPLYYTEMEKSVVFSSELKAIADNFPIPKDIQFEVVRQVQAHRYSLSQRDTFIESVKKVPPAHALIIRNGKITETLRYKMRSVKPTFGGTYLNAVGNVRDALFAAVERRLDSEVPIGLLLSAGVDSSAIACIAKRLGHEPLVFSAGYANDSTTDESNEAERLAISLGLPFRRVVLDESDFLSNFTDIVQFLDEPNADPALFPQWSLFRAINRESYKVILSGIGGDEVFYGYASKNGTDSIKALRQPHRVKKILSVGNSIFTLHKRASREKLAYLIHKTVNSGSLFKKSVLDEVAVKCREKGYRKLDMAASMEAGLEETIDQTYSALNSIYLPNNGFFIADKLGMANSIEVRCPFADKDLRDFVDSLPLDYKFPNGRPKGLLKDALRGTVPDYVLDRKKTGFTPPSGYLQKLVDRHRNVFFTEKAQTFGHVVTDVMCAKYAGVKK